MHSRGLYKVAETTRILNSYVDKIVMNEKKNFQVSRSKFLECCFIITNAI